MACHSDKTNHLKMSPWAFGNKDVRFSTIFHTIYKWCNGNDHHHCHSKKKCIISTRRIFFVHTERNRLAVHFQKRSSVLVKLKTVKACKLTGRGEVHIIKGHCGKNLGVSFFNQDQVYKQLQWFELSCRRVQVSSNRAEVESWVRWHEISTTLI